MRACCPDQVGGDNLVSPVICLARESPFGTVVLATTVAGVKSDTGATQDMTLGGYDCRWYDGGVTG
jgi:hypothetical protein